MPAKSDMLTFAAIGDLHVKEDRTSLFRELFAEISSKAEVLVLCGDLTDVGKPREAEVLVEDLRACSIPVVGVLGNHDYESGQADDVVVDSLRLRRRAPTGRGGDQRPPADRTKGSYRIRRRTPMRDPPLRRCNQLGQLLACIEHARLDRGLGDADDIGDLFDRFAMVVDEIDDLAVLRRQAG